jgi:hypothetical protein
MHFQFWLMNGIKRLRGRAKTARETAGNRLFAG